MIMENYRSPHSYCADAELGKFFMNIASKKSQAMKAAKEMA
jgi:hypothetical protein